MLRGLYTATSAMQTNDKKLDVITNNIANINTTGYKKDVVVTESFPEVLIKKVNGSNPFQNLDVFGGVEVKEENGAYEINTKGGFVRVQTPHGISHEKSVKCTVNEDGYLSTYTLDYNGNKDTKAGYLILGNRGPIKAENGALQVNERGQVVVGGNIVDGLIKMTPPGVIGTLNAGVKLDQLQINYDQGQLYETENNLDLGIKGKGFFKIETPDGLRYTRSGSFVLNSDHQLVTQDGHAVVGKNGPIHINGGNVVIDENGNIIADGEFVNKLDITDIKNIREMRKEGMNLYKLAEDAEAEEIPFEGKILQGFLEKSNVDPIKEMVEMIGIFRNYESSQKVIKAYDDTLGKAVNEVGKV
ncbi:flagellar hook-basal body protein [Anaerophilus nitritogenes]|uniref:flagellar hook-basal body protein n=1 Tax=Anaerophilus nitritogenes TaxID=2498136 RepID=UPI00101CDA37|nr:flagellar hook-basal body protein [Anaerophilus nitritogenes]